MIFVAGIFFDNFANLLKIEEWLFSINFFQWLLLFSQIFEGFNYGNKVAELLQIISFKKATQHKLKEK